MSEKVCVAFPEKGSEYSRAEQSLDLFNDNSHVRPFTKLEEAELVGLLSYMSKQGRRGIAHFVFGGSLTGLSLEDSIPATAKDFYRQIHFGADMDLWKAAQNPQFKRHVDKDENRIVVDGVGHIEPSDYQKLITALKDRSLIILGGGPGHPQDRIYRAFNLALEKELGAFIEVPVLGICLGHQFIHNLFGERSRGRGSSDVSEVVEGYNEIGSQMESVTEIGKQHPVFGRFGNMVNVVHVNEYHVKRGRDIVLTTNVLGEPSAYEIEIGLLSKIITWQAHPEFPMLGEGPQYRTEETKLVVPGRFRGSAISRTIPGGTSLAYSGLSQWLASDVKMDILASNYEAGQEDIANLVERRRLGKHLGVNFFGPALLYLLSQKFGN